MSLISNFTFLEEHDEQRSKLGLLAEKYFSEDPNTSLLKLRQLGELLAQLVAAQVGLLVPEEAQFKRLRRLQESGILPGEVARLFGEVRRGGNAASHDVTGDHRTALATLKFAWQISLWFHRTFKAPAYKSGPFIPPSAPEDESDALRKELEALKASLGTDQTEHAEASQQLEHLQSSLTAVQDEQAFWEQMALEIEQAKADLQKKLREQQRLSATLPKEAFASYASAADAAADALQLDEADTRKLIDQQLREAGWEADSQVLR